MSSKDIRPKWWQLYLVFPLLIALFAVDNRLKISTRGHQVVQVAILVIIFGLVHVWLKANATALSRIGQQQYYGNITVIHIPPVQAFRGDMEKPPMFNLPDTEIKGVLGDTFEMDNIDADSFTMEENRRN